MSANTPLREFHPLVEQWFLSQLGQPSAPQLGAWPHIREGRSVLLSAPTGSGKTLAAFLSCIDSLFRRALTGTLPSTTEIVYVSPLKALGNDVEKNLLEPLEALYALARAQGLTVAPIRVAVRSGDTPSSQRAAMTKTPPHILITTPESLYLCLTAERTREMLRNVHSVIVDEIHALLRDKRGSHLSLSLERLERLTGGPLQRVGLSATQKPIERVASFLMGAGRACELVQVGHIRPWDISIETPEDELSSVATHEMWGQVYDRLIKLIESHRSTLVFTNTRKLAERVAHDLGERIGHSLVAAHHGSMARELRLSAEERLKAGALKVMVATASLELGIDVGPLDLVCQLGSPRSIAVALQRIGRAGHRQSAVSKGVLFAMTRDELVECAALVKSIHEGHLDVTPMPIEPVDVLAQQIVAACSCEELSEDALFNWFRQADPYKELSRARFDQVLEMLSEGVATGRGRMRVHLHRDRVNGLLRARRGARLTALTNGGAIPETFSYPVIAEPEGKQVGTLDEDFAIESMAGDVFLLGSTSWRVQRIHSGAVRVEAAPGQPPSVPFWRGEAPSRTDVLSTAVGELREDLLEREDASSYLTNEIKLRPESSQALLDYLRASQVALGAMPSRNTLVAERFFDDSGGMQLLIHAPLGGRINRAWGLALRKRFCRSFDFELQAAATDDGIVLSLGEQHSFPLEDVFSFLSPENVEEVLTQAILQIPLFGTRFRHNATRALALQRNSGGKRLPPQIQRSRSDDLLAAVFPAQVGCQDNHGGGDIEVPDHPLVNETLSNCLHEAMDVEGLKEVLRELKAGRIRALAVDRPEPSPLAHQLLNAQPYAFLDDAPLEERRARAVSLRRVLNADDVVAFGALDAAAIAQVIAETQPLVRDADELHDALLQWLVMPENPELRSLLGTLNGAGRVGEFTLPLGQRFWFAAERASSVRALYDGAATYSFMPVAVDSKEVTRDEALVCVVRGWMEISGPMTAADLAERLGLSAGDINIALHALESQGQVIRGRFRAGATDVEWCDRRLLHRIHRRTLGKLRAEIEPLSTQDFMRFLFRWHHLDGHETLQGPKGLSSTLR